MDPHRAAMLLAGETVELGRWRSPASSYPRARVGGAAIRTAWYGPGLFECYNQRGYSMYRAERRLYVTTLRIGERTWMVDDPPHWWAMEDHAAHLGGHVLCAGLGLGLMVHALDARPEVSRITVVERDRDVIGLVGPLVPRGKLTIVHDDFYGVSPDAVGPVDGVLFDLFVGDSRELFDDAVSAAAGVIRKFERGRPLTVRVHGLPNPMIEQIARVVIAASDRGRTRIAGRVPR